jgi:hypothetical protein
MYRVSAFESDTALDLVLDDGDRPNAIAIIPSMQPKTQNPKSKIDSFVRFFYPYQLEELNPCVFVSLVQDMSV